MGTSLAHERMALASTIRNSISRGELVPGQRIIEADLCAAFKVERCDIRRVIEQLVRDRVLERVTQRGVRVRVVPLQEALDIADVRMEIECLCVSHAAQRATEEDIRTLREIGQQLTRSYEASDNAGFNAGIDQLFEAYVRIADHSIVGEELSRLRYLRSRHQYRLTFRTDRARTSLPLWLSLIEAICHHDPTAACDAVRRRTQSAKEAMKLIAHERS